MNLFVINAGSSSLKYQFFKMPSEIPVSTGIVEKIGAAGSFIKHKIGDRTIESNEFIANHADGLNKILAMLSEEDILTDPGDVEAVGHRIVHGGDYFRTATVITGDTKEKIGMLSKLAPLHNPVGLKCIEESEVIFPNAKHVAVFDTAFHQTMPEYAYRYAIPEPLYQEQKIRKYGFHGTSHRYVSAKAMDWLDKPDAKIISIHLGNGCSMTAIDSGRSVDTSMGFGPLSGLIMGTRSGDIDPSVIFHLTGNDTYQTDEINDMLNKQSGLRGFTGSNDMRDVRKMQQNGSDSAKLILDMYVYRIKTYIGSYTAVLNGLDAIVFTAGVGENDSMIRESICNGLEYLNIHLDKQKNEAPTSSLREINTDDAAVKIMVIPTNEELDIARQTYLICCNLSF